MLGVPVLGFKTEELTTFDTIKSGYNVDCKVDSAEELAAALKMK